MNKHYGVLRGWFLDFHDLRVLLSLVSFLHVGQGVPNSRNPFPTLHNKQLEYSTQASSSTFNHTPTR